MTAAAQSPRTILDTAREAGRFAVLLEAIEKSGWAEPLAGDGPYTVFAPDDEAFAQWPEGAVEWLLAEPETLSQVLTYHVVPGRVKAADVSWLGSVPTVQGERLFLSVNGVPRVDGAEIRDGDIPASNGVIHVIDRVLMPARI